MNKFPIDRTYHSMTIQKCPRFGVFDHYVFMCLSECEHFKGIHDGCVICGYGEKERKQPEFKVPHLDWGKEK